MNRWFCLASLLATFALASPGAPPSANREANRIIAKVNDAVITSKDVSAYVEANIPILQQLYGTQREVFTQKLEQLWRDGIQELINRRLVLDDFRKSGLVLPDSVIDDFIASRIKEQYKDRATLMQSLQAAGVTYESFRQDLKENFIVEQMFLRNISSAILISPHKIESYFRENTNQFVLPDQVHLRVIALNKSGPADTSRRRLAGELLTKLKEGVPFADLAKIYSDGSQRPDGGDWGWVDLTVLRKELADVARTMSPGQNSDIIETADGCFLIRLEARRSAHVRPLSEVRGKIEQDLVNRERARLQSRYIEKLRKSAFIRYFPD